MASLALAGALSGMGQGLERGLQQLQGGLVQYGLQDADRQFQSEKLKLQMEHAERLQQGSIGAAAAENEKNRALQSALHEQTEAGATARQQQQIGGSLTGASIQAEGAKEAAAAHAVSAEKIADMANQTHKDMNLATTQASKYAADEHLTAALLNSYSESQKALATDINRLEIIATDYKQDPNNPAYKAAVKDLQLQRQRSAQLSMDRENLQRAVSQAKGIVTPEPPAPKKFSISQKMEELNRSSSSSSVPQSSVAPPPVDPLAAVRPTPDPRSPMQGLVDTLVPKGSFLRP